MKSRPLSAAVLLVLLVSPLRAWDYEGHRIVNQLALAALPKEFPAFVREPANAERIAFLGGEPDRWRNNADLPIKHFNSPDHYLDFEELEQVGLVVSELPDLRQVYAAEVAFGRKRHAEKLKPIDPQRNADRTRELIGFLPWAIAENYGKLKSGFSYLRAFEEHGGTAEEIANAQANVVYIMGVMGHYVGDGSQPLHTTIHYNGWVGPNPKGYTTSNRFHSWIDGGFNERAGLELFGLLARVEPARLLPTAPRADGRDAVFVAVVEYLLARHAEVEPLYRLERDGKLKADGTPGSFDGADFLHGRLAEGGRMLASLWLTAWRTAPADTYLRTQLLKRQASAAPAR